MGEKKSETSGQFGIYAFGKDILIYSLGNGLLLLFGLIQFFIIPKYLTVEDYGYWGLFMLYTTYVYILHFGFNDGILLRWAGKELSQVGDEIKIAFRFLILEQFAVIIPLALLLYFLIHPPLQWMGLMILACAFVINLADFFINTARAFKRFRLLTAANVGKGLTFLALVVALFVAGYLNYHYVVFAFLASHLIFLSIFAYWFRKYLRGEKPSISSLWAYGKENINIGIFVLFGNLIGVLFLTTTDRLMVSLFFPIDQFAIYALASAMIAMVYIFVKAASDVVFPYISAVAPQLRSRAYHLGKSAIILLWAAILVIYFPIVWLIESYLPQYVASLPLMKILLCTVGFGSLIQILHVNYYKVYRKQRQYFLWGITALAFSVMLNLLAIKTLGTLESVAIATLTSFIVWYLINELSLKSVVGKTNAGLYKSIGVFACYIGAFWIASLLVDWFLAQMLIYFCFFCLVTWLFLRHQVRELSLIASEIRSGWG